MFLLIAFMYITGSNIVSKIMLTLCESLLLIPVDCDMFGGEKLFALFEWKWGLASHVSLHLKCTFHLAIYMISETRIEHTLS
jgi:hypothetical protein